MIFEQKLSRREFLAAGAVTAAGLLLGHHEVEAESTEAVGWTLTGLSTGFHQLDVLTGGLHRGELVLLASRPSMGKTSLALNITDHVAVKTQIPTLYVSLGTSRLEITERLLCSRGEVCHEAMRHLALPPDMGCRLTQAGSELSNSPLYLDDQPLRSAPEIGEIIERLNARLAPKPSVGFLVVDHLQHVEAEDSTQTESEYLIDIAYELHKIAYQMNLAVLGLIQINRPTYTNDSVPTLGELYRTQYAADVVLLLHRPGWGIVPNEVKESSLETKAELSVIRRSPRLIETIDLAWNSQYMCFSDRHVYL